MSGGNHGFFCSCKRCHKRYSTPGDMLPDYQERGERRERSPRSSNSTPLCDDCRGSGMCQECRGAAKETHNCNACRPRGPRANDGDWGRCWACHGRGKKRQSSNWQSGGSVDGKEARTKEQGTRTDAIWGGIRGNQPGDGHGHIVSKDGINAEYLRNPGMDHDDYVVDQRKNSPYGPRRRRK